MNLFKSQFEIVKPQRLVWRLENPSNQVAGTPSSPEMTTREQQEKQIKYWEKQLSPQGKELWSPIRADFVKRQKDFIKDAKETLFNRSEVTTGGEATVFGDFANMFIYRINQSALSCLKEISTMDRDFETGKKDTQDPQELRNLKEQYERKVAGLHLKIQNELNDTVNQFSSTTEGFGKGVIDTGSELSRLKQNMNVLKDKGLSALIVKLTEGRDLRDQDYEMILGGLTELMGERSIDTTRLDRTIDSVQAIEVAGKTAILNLMTPAQRFKLGKRLVEKANQNDTFSKEQAHKGLLTLSAMGFLDIGQVESLLEALGFPMKDEEKKDIHESRKIMIKVREKMEHYMKKGGGGNWIKKHLTASNGLIYEIIGRIGLIGAGLPFALHALHPERWPAIMADPVWMGCVAISAGAIDHMSGGIGQGAVTKNILKIGEEKPKETDETRRGKFLKKLDQLKGDFKGIFKFMERPGFLSKANRLAAQYEAPNKGARYVFSSKDFVSSDGKLPLELKTGLDGCSPHETEQIIAEAFGIMRYDLSAADAGEMERVLAGSRERRGLDPSSTSSSST
ncbi:MAG: hypothetical protein WCW30_02125 [Candidatus Gracilibacteria bacterium]